MARSGDLRTRVGFRADDHLVMTTTVLERLQAQTVFDYQSVRTCSYVCRRSSRVTRVAVNVRAVATMI